MGDDSKPKDEPRWREFYLDADDAAEKQDGERIDEMVPHPSNINKFIRVIEHSALLAAKEEAESFRCQLVNERDDYMSEHIEKEMLKKELADARSEIEHLKRGAVGNWNNIQENIQLKEQNQRLAAEVDRLKTEKRGLIDFVTEHEVKEQKLTAQLDELREAIIEIHDNTDDVKILSICRAKLEEKK